MCVCVCVCTFITQSGYFADRQALQTGAFFRPPLPWSELQSGIAYVNSNCHALNGRNDIVQHLMGLNRIPVDSYGVCLRNKPVRGVLKHRS